MFILSTWVFHPRLGGSTAARKFLLLNIERINVGKLLAIMPNIGEVAAKAGNGIQRSVGDRHVARRYRLRSDVFLGHKKIQTFGKMVLDRSANRACSVK